MIVLEVVFCVLSAGFFAGLETGLLSADPIALYAKKEKRILYARAASFLLRKPERLLGVTLIGTNLSMVTAAILLNDFLRHHEPAWISWIGSLSLSLIILIFSEIVPKSFFRRHADIVGVRLASALFVFYLVFLPFSLIFTGVIRLILNLFIRKPLRINLPRSRDDLRLLVRLSGRESGLDRSEMRVFEDIFDFRDTLAREVMLPFHEYPVCPEGAALRELVQTALDKKRRFIPVYRERADKVIGYVDVEDALATGPSTVPELMRKPVFYPATNRIPDLLMMMNTRKLDMVFLVDEYGNLCGLITPAEIASEIVGFIPGGHGPGGRREINCLGPGSYVVPAGTNLEDLVRETGVRLSKGSYETLGGFLCARLGEIPRQGDILEEGGVRFKVLEGDGRRLQTIEMVKKEKTRGI